MSFAIPSDLRPDPFSQTFDFVFLFVGAQVGCLLCDQPARVLAQSLNEIVVLAEPYNHGLKHPV